MASTVGHQGYDESLLASAPVATKAQLQSGYNPDLLVEKHTPPPSRQGITPAPARDGRDLESQAVPPKAPFYRTKKGIIIIAVAVVVVIAVVVGGAVGGSKKKNKTLASDVQGAGTQSGAPASNSTSASSSSTTAGNSQGVAGPSPSSSSGDASATLSKLFPSGIPSGFSLPITQPITQPTTLPQLGVNQEVGPFAGFS
ncbi:hypothetical protein GALMADRAFT_244978 [Galerina marginata CBS 339.88]|uniref:Uncharacterized protein n=1 Tax=Galerina marginata (strain CBS 339.88) TaxID=685588 RepID=A0A067T6Q6_GALM3|nr:hypothetical protein GALMADRAFT_244978 [Galerina marginata CBS 339.88]